MSLADRLQKAQQKDTDNTRFRPRCVAVMTVTLSLARGWSEDVENLMGVGITLRSSPQSRA